MEDTTVSFIHPIHGVMAAICCIGGMLVWFTVRQTGLDVIHRLVCGPLLLDFISMLTFWYLLCLHIQHS